MRSRTSPATSGDLSTSWAPRRSAGIKRNCFATASWRTIRWLNGLTALRFFYSKTLGRSWSVSLTPYPKRVCRLPSVLSQQEVARLIEATDSVIHHATGVRRAELIRLQLRDIDSERMVVHVRGGKGRKDRDVMLSQQLNKVLRLDESD